MTTDEVKQEIIETQGELIKELTRELQRIRRSNLRIRMHMQVLVNHPSIRTSSRIRERYRLPGINRKGLLTTSLN